MSVVCLDRGAGGGGGNTLTTKKKMHMSCTVDLYAHQRDALRHADNSCVVVQQSCPTYPNIAGILHLLVVIHVTSAYVEWANPSLKFLKTDLRSTISQSRLKKKWMLFSCCSSIVQHNTPGSPSCSRYFPRSQPRRLLFLNPLANSWKDSCASVIGAFQSSLEQACKLHFLWYGLGRLLVLYVRSVLITFLMHPLSHRNSKLRVFAVNKWTVYYSLHDKF